MSRVLAFAFLGLAIGCASAPRAAPAPGVTPTVSVFAHIPAEIDAFKLTRRTAISGMPSDSLFRFSDGSRTLLSVIIYDIGADVRVDADSQKWTAREGEKFKLIQDINVRRRRIASYELAFADTVRFPAGESNILQHAIVSRIRLPGSATFVEMQYLYLIGGKFVKVRATIPGESWQQTGVPSFARELALHIASGL